MRRLSRLAAFALLALAACTTTPLPPPNAPAPRPPAAPTPRPVPPPVARLEIRDLPGWAGEDHLAALEAFRAGCGVAREPGLAEICRQARALSPRDDAEARLFIETRFRPEPVGDPGLLTAYFAPEYEARMSRTAEFTAPVRGRPADLALPYADRAAIEATPCDQPLAWMRPEDLFMMQIQGSGMLTLPDGRRVRAAFAAHNGLPFVGVASAMRDQGLLAADATSADAIRAWLAEHRGPEADAIMRLNPRYVFFKMAEDDGREPVGAAGVALPAGRAIAVDPSRHDYGAPYWIDASDPRLAGAFPTYRRLVLALDTGGAIKGDVRADLYMGTGAAAGLEAGRVKHALRLYRLVPRS
ncbi:MAG: MltA domain protein [Caulobacter sp.]|nr:MltA domain protein [Caulobacter sp.]